MEELIEAISDYVRKPYTDYAVMLNGEWGSGKTYFWNNKLRSRLEAIKTIDGKSYKTIYMSLYGINSLEEISKKIFIETNPMISKSLKKFVDTREGNLIPEYVKTGLDMANLFGSMQFSSHRVDFSKMFAIDDKILCFDDLERANVDVIDILGYINNFVEHDGIKTILICNEKELATKFKNSNIEMKTLIATQVLDKEGKLVKNIDRHSSNNVNEMNLVPLNNMIEEKISEIFEKANDYERIKEKLIGETFEYIPEYTYILNGMIMKYSYNEDLVDFLKRNTSVIIFAFNKTNTRNLRILKHSLNDFEKIYTNIVKDYPSISADILRNILLFTIAVSFEIKAGHISKEKFSSIKDNNEYLSIIYTSKILSDNNTFYIREFDNKYFSTTINKFRFFKFVEVYIRTRYFDDIIYKKDLEEATSFFKTKNNSNEQRYLELLSGDYLKLADIDFNILIGQVMEEIKIGSIKFEDYIKLFLILNYLIDIKLIEYTKSDLKQSFTLGMQIAAKSTKNIEELSDELNFEYDLKNENTKWIITEYLKIKNMVIEEKSVEKANEVFRNLPDNITDFLRLLINDYAKLPVFSKYDMNTLYEKLTYTTNYDLHNIISLIKERYKENKELLNNEKDSLLKLSAVIKERNVPEKKTIKNVLLDNLKNIIYDVTKK